MFLDNNNDKDKTKSEWLKREKYLRLFIVKILIVFFLVVLSLIFIKTFLYEIIQVLSCIVSLVADGICVYQFLKIYKGE